MPSVRRGTIPQDATLTSGSGDAGALRLVGGAMGSGADLKRVSRLEWLFRGIVTGWLWGPVTSQAPALGVVVYT